MTHRVFVVWGGHRKGQAATAGQRKRTPGLRRGEWAFGGGDPMDLDSALTVAASLRVRGHQARVVDLAGAHIVVPAKLHPLRALIEHGLASKPPKRRRTSSGVQLMLLGGVA